MDVFDLSPKTPQKPPMQQPAVPVDIPFEDPHGNDYALVDEKAGQILQAENQKLDELTGKFTKGFDPDSFDSDIKSFLPTIVKSIVPGSYNHLLFLLFESYEAIQYLQVKMESCLFDRYKRPTIIHPDENSINDEIFMASEIEMLRKLLEPIREDNKESIYWLNSRRAEPTWACEELETSIKLIETFKTEIISALDSDVGVKTMYSNLPISVERTTMFSLKQFRLDACRESLSWDKYTGSDLEITNFFRFYKAYVSEHEPAKARASGWLPPTSPEPPRMSAPEAGEGDLAYWPPGPRKHEVLNILLKTALWLGTARGLAAVHLFCDVTRVFTLRNPPETANDEHICFLQLLTRLRASTEGSQSSLSPPIQHSNQVFPTRNIDYFEDVWKSTHKLFTGLFDNLSFYANGSKFKLAMPPPGRRSRPRDMQLIISPRMTQENSDSAPSTPEESISDMGDTDEIDVLGFSPEKKPAIWKDSNI